MLDVVFALSATVSELAQILETAFVPDDPSYTGPIGKAIHNVLSYHNSEMLIARDCELQRLQFLAQNLREIRSYDSALVQNFRDRLIFGRVNQFIGTRFEFAITASLIMKHIAFVKRESQDFTLQVQGREVYVECASQHSTSLADRNLKIKIRKGLNRKAREPYANGSTIVFMDITNLYHNSFNSSKPFEYDGLKEYALSALRLTLFAGLLLYYNVVMAADSSTRLANVYLRIDQHQQQDWIGEFLNQYYPTKQEHDPAIFVPPLA